MVGAPHPINDKNVSNNSFLPFFLNKNKMNIEEKVRSNLFARGFNDKTMLNNRGLISAVIDETIIELVKKNISNDTNNSQLLEILEGVYNLEYRLYPEGESPDDYPVRVLRGQGFLNAIKVVTNFLKN